MYSFDVKSHLFVNARWLAVVLSGVLATSVAHADFSLNFRPNLRKPDFKEVQFEVKQESQTMELKAIY